MPTALRCVHCAARIDPGRKFCTHDCYVASLRAESARTLVTRFWAKVKKTPTCWLWTAATLNGYGEFHLPRVESCLTVYAHRYAWTLTNGPIPDNLSVLHKCDVRLCVNPNHLFLGTQNDNLLDARAKGRLVCGRHLVKVSDAGLADICRRYHPRHNGKQLAAEYGITLVHLLRIVNGTARVRPQFPFVRVPHVELPIRGDLHVGSA